MGWKQWINRDSAGKKHFASLLGAVAIAMVGATAGTAVLAQTAPTGIAGTKHNLGSTGTGTNVFSGTAEICVFCHTPHGADATAVVPLWNRTLPAASTFTTYDALGTTSLDGKTAPVGSVSIACLSCHDGVTAMNSLLNAPGSGAGGDTTWTGGAWTSGTGKITGIANIGAGLTAGDLRNDHPIGIQYGGGGLSTKTPTGATKDADFRVAATGTANNQTVWWVDTAIGGAAGTRQKTDMMLYTRVAASGYTGQTDPEPFVECASCHDPHSTNTTFLRIQNTGSAVCLACHIK